MTMSKLVKNSHESFPYNRNMAHALYRSTFLESWGSGIRHIIEACQEQGVEEPTWRWDGAFVYVTFKRPDKYDPSTVQDGPKSDSSKGENKGESKGKSSPDDLSKVKSNRSKVVALLSKNTRLTLPEIASSLNLSLGGVEKIVRPF